MKKSSRIKRNEELGLKLPILGKIKVGEMVEGKKYPTSLDYFVATGKYKDVFNQAFPDKPKKLEIFFISDDPMLSCFEQYECRDAQGRLVAYGDGEQSYLWNPTAKIYASSTDKEALKNAGKWKPVLKIRFIIAKIKTVFGLWEFSTSGDKSSIPQIRDSFDTILERVGRISGIPFDLCVEKVKSQKPGDSSSFPIVSMISNIGSENLQLLSDYIQTGGNINQIGAITNDKIKLLGNPNDQTEDITAEEVK